MEREANLRDVFEAAFDFNRLKLWERFTNFDCFAVRVPREASPMLAVVMGNAGEQFGLSLFRGPTAPRCLSALLAPQGPGDDVLEDVDVLSFSMDAFGALPVEAQALARRAGLRPRFGDLVPHFMAKRPGRQPRLPDDAEMRLLLLVLRGILRETETGRLQPSRLDDAKGVITLSLAGEPGAPEVQVRRERLEVGTDAPERPSCPGHAGLRDLPRLNATWLVGLPPTPGTIANDDRSLQLLLVVDQETDLIIDSRLILGAETDEACEALFKLFEGKSFLGRRGLPREMVFTSRRLYDAAGPSLRAAGVSCRYAPAVAKLARIASEFAAHMETAVPDDSLRQDAAMDDAVPAPEDLFGWKRADRRLARRFAESLRSEDRLRSSRAANRYFGSGDIDYYFDAHAERAVVMAYTAWGVLDYRPTKRSKTLAEKLLARGLPEAEEALLRARMEAHPSLYRVTGHDPQAGTVALQDVLLGGSVTVYDQLMSENIDDGVFLAARAFPAGRFHFLEPAGPPLGPLMGMEATEYLQRCGLKFVREELRRNAHIFGWLWDWMDEREESGRMPLLRNTDGDDLLWHTASFGVADEQAARRALVARKDVAFDPDANEFVWSRDDERSESMLGGPVTLGRMEFVGDEIVLQANSAERFAKAREWLEAIPGVALRGVTTRDLLSEEAEDQPLDERISPREPVEMTPELHAAVQDLLDKQYMAWLDRPLPVLKGLTPREACRTAPGRQSVAALIRTIPEPGGPAPVRVPRDVMLRELGIGGTEPAADRADEHGTYVREPLPDPLPVRKVGRNQPCPCGSGKKYKKCCGRAVR